MQSVDAAGATEAALLVTAVWSLRRDVAERVDPHRPRLQSTCDAMGAGEVAGMHERVQAIGGVVGEAHGVGFVVEPDHGDDRTERLDLSEVRRVVDVAEDGGLDVVAVRELAADALPAGEEFTGALIDGTRRSRRGFGRVPLR